MTDLTVARRRRTGRRPRSALDLVEGVANDRIISEPREVSHLYFAGEQEDIDAVLSYGFMATAE
jgi:hypothetical protein